MRFSSLINLKAAKNNSEICANYRKKVCKEDLTNKIPLKH